MVYLLSFILFFASNPTQRLTRDLVIQSGFHSGNLLLKQNMLLENAGTGLRERDVRIVRRKGEPFRIILFGKDGGIKYQSDTPISPKVLFDIIDRMPMRQQEMKHT